MSPVQYFALKHPAMIHFPIAATLFLVPALLLARRGKENAEAWNVTARYLAWLGLLSFLPPLFSGFLWAKGMSLIPAGHFLAPTGDPGDDFALLIRRHQILSLLGLAAGIATVWFLSRRRERPGRLAVSLGCLWMVVTLATGYFGGKMTHPIATAPDAAASADTAAGPPRT